MTAADSPETPLPAPAGNPHLATGPGEAPGSPSPGHAAGPSHNGKAPAGENPEVEFVSWEDDENHFTRGTRSLFVLVAGAFLLWAQWKAPLQPGLEWGRWVGNSVISNFVIPVGLVWLFLAHSFSHLDWLKDQRHNAWSYGWNWKPARRHLLVAGACLLVSLPFLWVASRQPGIQEGYRHFVPYPTNMGEWAYLLTTLVVYMFCWEFFFRGFLLFGMAHGFGPILAIMLQAGLFCAAHAGKPPVEMWGALPGGLFLGALCWKEKSFAPAFYIHALIHVTWVILVCH